METFAFLENNNLILFTVNNSKLKFKKHIFAAIVSFQWTSSVIMNKVMLAANSSFQTLHVK